MRYLDEDIPDYWDEDDVVLTHARVDVVGYDPETEEQ